MSEREFPTNIDIALLAGLFTILVARIVDEAVWLAGEVRATIQGSLDADRRQSRCDAGAAQDET